jgi:hypothetical protein
MSRCALRSESLATSVQKRWSSRGIVAVIPRSGCSIEEVAMIQRGQVLRLQTKGADGEPLWAYRYRLEGRGSARPQVGGFSSRAEAQKALAKELARLGSNGRAATITLAELVDEYLELHQAERVTIAKLRWRSARQPQCSGRSGSPICRRETCTRGG